jgi:hypothetical protein
MKVAVFEEIAKELKKQKRKSPWLAEETERQRVTCMIF